MISIINTPLGAFRIREESGAVTELYPTPEFLTVVPSPLASLVQKELTEYLQGERKSFTVPIQPKGTAFQQAVGAALSTVPYGQTCTYKAVADTIGRPKACRAVGGAIHRNPILILIPCHRIIGSDGSLMGFGAGPELKQTLLNLEEGNTP